MAQFPQTGVDAARAGQRQDRFLSLATAAVYNACSPSYQWALGYLMALVIRCVTMRAMAVDFVGAFVPGSIRSTPLMRLATLWGRARDAAGVEVHTDCNVILGYDNNGIYNRVCSRFAGGSNAFPINVIINRRKRPTLSSLSISMFQSTIIPHVTDAAISIIQLLAVARSGRLGEAVAGVRCLLVHGRGRRRRRESVEGTGRGEAAGALQQLQHRHLLHLHVAAGVRGNEDCFAPEGRHRRRRWCPPSRPVAPGKPRCARGVPQQTRSA